MKKLSFYLAKKETYEVLFAVAVGASVKGSTEIENSLGTIKAFRAIGLPVEENNKEKIFYTIDQDCVLELEDAQFKWLKDRFEDAPFSNSTKIEQLAEAAELIKNPK
jgi:hypothetical protein